jgi:hypothetical protein
MFNRVQQTDVLGIVPPDDDPVVRVETCCGK